MSGIVYMYTNLYSMHVLKAFPPTYNMHNIDFSMYHYLVKVELSVLRECYVININRGNKKEENYLLV
jgi:hypothetical protein